MAYYLMPPNGQPATLVPSLPNGKPNGSLNGHANGHANGSVNGHTNGHTNGSVNGHTNGSANGHVNGSVNGSVNGNTNGSANGHTNGAVDGVKANGASETPNPTVIPLEVLKKYHFTFLIRHPRRSIPSYYRCTVPPLDAITGFSHFMSNEAGYAELRVLFDYLREQKLVGPHMAGDPNSSPEDEVRITVMDADDLLDHPREIIEAFCKETGIEFTPKMLTWDNPEDQRYVQEAFAKWIGFHNDAIKSTCLSARTKAHVSI
jgi:hypothetical protein